MNETNKTRNLIRQDRLESFGRILFNRKNLVLKLSYGSRKLASSDSKNKVWVNSKLHEDVITNLILQKGLTLHEMGHIMFTNASVWKRSNVSFNFANIIEDGRVEEAVSRMFPKARLYFVYVNRMFLAIKEQQKDLENSNISSLINQLVMRESMKRTGIPQLPDYVHVYLKDKLGSDYRWILDWTRKAIDAKKEKECVEITIVLYERIREIIEREKQTYDNNKTTSSEQSSVTNSGGIARSMPKEIKDTLSELLDNQEPDFTAPTEVDSPLDDSGTEQIIVSTETSDSSETSDSDVGDSEKESENETETTDVSTSQKPGKSEESEESEEDSNDKQDDIESLIESVVNQVKDIITEDVKQEIKVENDIIKSGDANAEFGDYDVDEDDNGEGHDVYGRYRKQHNPIDTKLLEGNAVRIAQQFKVIAQFGDGWKHAQTRGKLETHRLSSLYTNNTPKIFKKRDKIQGVDLCVSILLDASGSMSRECIEATQISYVIARALEIGKYKSEAVQFGVGSIRSSGTHDIYGLKSFNQTLHYAKRRFVPKAIGATPLLTALEGARKSLGRQNSQRKVCFVITDGYPYDPRYPKEDGKVVYREKCKQEILNMEKQGIVVIGVMIRLKDERSIFRDGFKFSCNQVKDVEHEMVKVLKNVLQSLK